MDAPNNALPMGAVVNTAEDVVVDFLDVNIVVVKIENNNEAEESLFDLGTFNVAGYRATSVYRSHAKLKVGAIKNYNESLLPLVLTKQSNLGTSLNRHFHKINCKRACSALQIRIQQPLNNFL
jgi:hypothetical protein